MVAVGTLVMAITLLAAETGSTSIGGIGLLFVEQDDGKPLRIEKVHQGSPAEKAGIKARSFLISIDGTNVVSLSLTQMVHMVRGPVGSSITLEVADPTMSQTNKFEMKRRKMVFSKDKIEFVDPNDSR